MTTENILLVIAITIIALLVTLFQYFFKAKRTSKKTVLFAFLRFLGIVTILLLLVNPQIKVTTSKQEKPQLTVLVDHSKSISFLEQEAEVKKLLSTVNTNKALQEKFDVVTYSFGSTLTDSVSADFSAKQTKIEESISNIQKINRKTNSPIVLITDGNQTYGKDYSYFKSKFNQPIFSIPLGDTTSVSDLYISTVNANKYVYLNNEFPIEIIGNYRGKENQKTTLSIYNGKRKVFSKQLQFSKDRKSHFVNAKLKATTVGLQNYTMSLSSFEGEKNITNNSKQLLIETIDQKTSVLLVSNIVHPDIGALKRSIESNKRRRLKVIKASELKSLDNTELVILYQPDRSFKEVYSLCDKIQMPLFTITGKKTDWDFLNSLKQNYSKPQRTQVEDIIPVLNTNFETFNTDQFNFSKYPPLESTFGQERLQTPYETLLYKKVANVTTDNPLLSIWSSTTKNEAVLFGEGFWKWRLANFKRDGDFDKFDDFFGKIIQYLSNKKVRKRLTTNYENEYYTNNSVVISASYFNKNYEFDAKAQLVLSLTKENDKASKKTAMLLKGSFYEASFNDLSAGSYKFSIQVTGSKLKAYGGFVVKDFDIEKQFLNPNITSLNKLSTQNYGSLVYPGQITNFVNELIVDERYKPIIKYSTEHKSLIHWKWLLGFLVFIFSLEWFLRKYNGLI